MSVKIFYYDLETTGLDPAKHAIHQLAAFIEIGGEVVDRINIKMAPHPKAAIEPEALKVSGVTLEELQSRQDYLQGYAELVRFLGPHVDRFDRADKLFLCGYNNAKFDDGFLRMFFELCNNKYFGSYFWSHALDVIVLAGEYLKHRRAGMDSFKLFRVARELGLHVDEERLHDAYYDLELTREVYKIVSGEITEI